MKQAYIIQIIENHKLPQLNNTLFMVTSEKEDDIMFEDGNIGKGNILKGYLLSQLPNSKVTVSCITEYTFLQSDLQYAKVANCSYVKVPQIIDIRNEVKDKN